MITDNSKTLTIFDFKPDCDMSSWYVVNDGVMGGRSLGSIDIDEKGHFVFHGQVSLENNGGFTSVRYPFPRKEFENMSHLKLRLKGDGKAYQIRFKASVSQRYSYIGDFETTGVWEDVKIPLDAMYPAFRGRRLDLPNFSYDYLEEIGILIGNKRAESFELMIDNIVLEGPAH